MTKNAKHVPGFVTLTGSATQDQKGLIEALNMSEIAQWRVKHGRLMGLKNGREKKPKPS